MSIFGPNIRKMTRGGDVEGLVALLEDKDPKNGAGAARALAQLVRDGESQAVVESGAVMPLFKGFLQCSASWCCSSFLGTLRELAHSSQARYLIPYSLEALREGKPVDVLVPEIAIMESKALLEAGVIPAFVEATRCALGDDDAQQSVANNLIHLVLNTDARAMVRNGGLKQLVEALEDEDPWVCWGAAISLQEFVMEDAGAVVGFGAVPALLTMMNRFEEDPVSAALQVFWRLAQKGKEQELREMGAFDEAKVRLEDEDAWVRMRALLVMGEMGEEDSLAAVKASIAREEEGDVRNLAIETLEKFKNL